MPSTEVLQNPCPCCGLSRPTLESPCGDCDWRPVDTRGPSLYSAQLTAKMLLQAARTISMASLFQVTFIAAICATLVAFDWRLGATVSLIAFVALCRTTLFCVYRRARTIPAGSWELVGAFLQSMAFVGTIATCSVIAFLMTCTPCAIMAKSWQMGTIAGSAFGGLTFALLLWLTPVFRGPN